MKRMVLLVFLSIGAFTTPCFSQVRVGVMPFEVGDHGLQRYAGFARGELEKVIMRLGNVVMVDRERIDQMAREHGNVSGMADPGQVAPFGKMLGARILVSGSLLTVRKEERQSGGSSSSRTTVAMRIRAYDVEKGMVTYSSPSTGSSSSSTNVGSTDKGDQTSAAIEAALKSLGLDPRFKELFAKPG